MSLLCRLFLLTLLLGAVTCHADRDIVYAARYYTPPGSHRTSHFHLYRMNPDGTGRRQLTFGSKDDTAPRWSPDGRRDRLHPRQHSPMRRPGRWGPVQTLMRDRDDPKDPHSISDRHRIGAGVAARLAALWWCCRTMAVITLRPRIPLRAVGPGRGHTAGPMLSCHHRLRRCHPPTTTRPHPMGSRSS